MSSYNLFIDGYNTGRIIDVFDPHDFNVDSEYSIEREYTGFAVKREDVVLTERYKYEITRRREF